MMAATSVSAQSTDNKPKEYPGYKLVSTMSLTRMESQTPITGLTTWDIATTRSNFIPPRMHGA